MFSLATINQLLNTPPSLRDSITQILGASPAALSNAEIESATKAWASKRDISLELQAMKKLGLVEILEFDESVYPPVGKWKLVKMVDADWDEKRIDVIGQNGNDGLHYS